MISDGGHQFCAKELSKQVRNQDFTTALDDLDTFCAKGFASTSKVSISPFFFSAIETHLLQEDLRFLAWMWFSQMRNRSHDQPKPLSLLSSLRPPEECPAQPNLNSAGWRWCVPARLKSAKAFATKASGLREFRNSWMSAPRTLHGVQLKWSCRRPRTQKKAISLPRKNYLNSANDAPSTIYIYPDSIIDCLSR